MKEKLKVLENEYKAEQEEKKDWSKALESLKEFFNSSDLPKEPIMLNQCTRIDNIELFIKTHLSIAEENNKNQRYLPYFERLKQLKKIL